MHRPDDDTFPATGTTAAHTTGQPSSAQQHPGNPAALPGKPGPRTAAADAADPYRQALAHGGEKAPAESSERAAAQAHNALSNVRDAYETVPGVGPEDVQKTADTPTEDPYRQGP